MKLPRQALISIGLCLPLLALAQEQPSQPPVPTAPGTPAVQPAPPAPQPGVAYARVLSSTPIYLQQATPQQQCVEVQREVKRSSGVGSLFGAIMGAAIGNQFGSGSGRALATGLGMMMGSAIGNEAELDGKPSEIQNARQCRRINAYETRIVGYDVVYEFDGLRYQARVNQAPGAFLALQARAQAPMPAPQPPLPPQP